jgi:hypothetical protein
MIPRPPRKNGGLKEQLNAVGILIIRIVIRKESAYILSEANAGYSVNNGMRQHIGIAVP